MVREIVKKGLVGLLFLFIASCGDIGGSGQCGGAEGTGACLRIESVEPKYNEKKSSNVDTVRDICNFFEVKKNPADTEAKFELFTDHSAELTVSNKPLPGVRGEDISDITLVDYRLAYSQPNLCPSGANCPTSLTALQVAPGQTTVIPANGPVKFTLPFFQISSKDEYNVLGGSPNAYPSYTATYTIRGTDSFRNPVIITGSAEFTIGNYDYCT